MNKTVRTITSFLLMPALIFLASAACCCPKGMAHESSVKQVQTVLDSQPHHCCPESKDCAHRSMIQNHDDAIQSSLMQVHSSDSQIQKANSRVELKTVSSSFGSFAFQFSFHQSDQVKLSSIQLLI